MPSLSLNSCSEADRKFSFLKYCYGFISIHSFTLLTLLTYLIIYASFKNLPNFDRFTPLTYYFYLTLHFMFDSSVSMSMSNVIDGLANVLL